MKRMIRGIIAGALAVALCASMTPGVKAHGPENKLEPGYPGYTPPPVTGGGSWGVGGTDNGEFPPNHNLNMKIDKGTARSRKEPVKVDRIVISGYFVDYSGGIDPPQAAQSPSVHNLNMKIDKGTARNLNDATKVKVPNQGENGTPFCWPPRQSDSPKNSFFHGITSANANFTTEMKEIRPRQVTPQRVNAQIHDEKEPSPKPPNHSDKKIEKGTATSLKDLLKTELPSYHLANVDIPKDQVRRMQDQGNAFTMKKQHHSWALSESSAVTPVIKMSTTSAAPTSSMHNLPKQTDQGWIFNGGKVTASAMNSQPKPSQHGWIFSSAQATSAASQSANSSHGANPTVRAAAPMPKNSIPAPARQAALRR